MSEHEHEHPPASTAANTGSTSTGFGYADPPSAPVVPPLPDAARDAHSGHDPHAGHDANAGAHGHPGHDGHSGHDAHAAHDHSAHDPAQFQRKFWLSLAFTVPTMVFSTGLQDILGLSGPRFTGSQFIPAVFGVVLFFYGGLVFLRGAVTELRARQPGMMTLISLAIVVALGYSLAVTLGLQGMDFWWELATLITIMLLGHWIEMSAVMGASDALGELAKLIPDEAEVVHGDHVMTVPVSSLKLGERVLVRPGATVPADGDVVVGASEVDEALLTGESRPVAKQLGASVVGGSVNGSGALTVQVTRLGDDSALGGIMRMVADAQASRSPVQLLADRAASLLFYVSVAAALVTLVVWVLLRPDEPTFVLERVVTVLVIACPHALGLAIPLVAQLSTSIGARRGILIRDRGALEQARGVDLVLFDKTGTLTEGRQGVDQIVSLVGADGVLSGGGGDENAVLALAAAVEASSEHPIARAIVAAARERELDVPEVDDFTSLAGRGARATVGARQLIVGSRRLVTERGIKLHPDLVNASRAAAAEGMTTVFLVDAHDVKRGAASPDDPPTALAMFAIADVVRKESAEAVATLRARGIRVAMLTGDSAEVAQHVAKSVGIDEVFADVLPEQKAAVVTRLKSEGATVAMVGDGVNDAPALATADLGIAIGAGTDVAIQSAGIVLATGDPRAVADALALSAATYRKMLQNLAWATGYNAIGIPLAAGVLAGVGILLPPALGAVFMSVSTIVVAVNAQLLRRLKLTGAPLL